MMQTNIPVGFKDVSDSNSDGRCYVHETLPLAICVDDNNENPELYSVDRDKNGSIVAFKFMARI